MKPDVKPLEPENVLVVKYEPEMKPENEMKSSMKSFEPLDVKSFEPAEPENVAIVKSNAKHESEEKPVMEPDVKLVEPVKPQKVKIVKPNDTEMKPMKPEMESNVKSFEQNVKSIENVKCVNFGRNSLNMANFGADNKNLRFRVRQKLRTFRYEGTLKSPKMGQKMTLLKQSPKKSKIFGGPSPPLSMIMRFVNGPC